VNHVFVAVPTWREGSLWDKGKKDFVDTVQAQALKKLCSARTNKTEYTLLIRSRMNTPFATSVLAEHFDRGYPQCDWFLLFSDDQILTGEDCERLIACADRYGADIIGGIVTLKNTDKAWCLAGTFGDGGLAVYYRRGMEITDEDVLSGRTKPVEWLGGACLIRRGVIEKFRPDRNGGLPYWAFDHWAMSYDYRFFERAKAFGLKTLLQCGVLVGHVGEEGTFDGADWQPDEKGTPRTWTFWDSPVIENKDGIFPNQCTRILDDTPKAREQTHFREHVEGAIVG